MQTVQQEIIDELHMQYKGLSTPDEPFYRRVIWEILEDRLPKGAQSRVRFHINNIMPNAWCDWHIHNGPSYHLVLQGRVALERVGDEPTGPDWRVPAEYREEYHAGEALTEPIGIPHRAGNPDSSVECVSVTLLLTEVDRHHIIRLGSEKPIGTPI